MTIDEMTTTAAHSASYGTRLPDSVLQTFRERAQLHDRTGTYAVDDLAALRDVSWFKAALPATLGGLGLDLVELGQEQRRLARYSPATALSTSMHHYWVGAAADLYRAKSDLGQCILSWTASDQVLASGHAEAGNDIPVALSTTTATRVPGGWRIKGRKMFGSLGEHWDRIGIHAMDVSGMHGPAVVHAFVPRDAQGVRPVKNWDAQGMRATESHDTVLENVFVDDADVLCVVPAGPTDHPFVGVMQLWALTLIANVYIGIAERAEEIAVQYARTRTSIALPGGTYASSPFVQHQVAEMHLALHAARAVVDGVAHDWVNKVDHGNLLGPNVLSAKWHATQAALRVVDLACEVVGGSSYRTGTELERLSRDVRAARFHPGTDAFTHEQVGKALLGVNPAGPRW